MQTINDLQLSSLKYAQIRAFAEQIGNHYGVYDEQGKANLDILLQAVNGKVVTAYNERLLTLAYSPVRKETDITITVPNATSARRKRFAVSKSLGHYFLHHDPKNIAALTDNAITRIVYDLSMSNDLQIQANVFISSLLLPSQQFAKAYKEMDGDPWKLSALFEVSPKSAEYRAEVLGIVSK